MLVGLIWEMMYVLTRKTCKIVIKKWSLLLQGIWNNEPSNYSDIVFVC